MVQIELISSMIMWERRLEFTEERRKSHRPEPLVNYLAAPQTGRSEKAQRRESQESFNLVRALNTRW